MTPGISAPCDHLCTDFLFSEELPVWKWLQQWGRPSGPQFVFKRFRVFQRSAARIGGVRRPATDTDSCSDHTWSGFHTGEWISREFGILPDRSPCVFCWRESHGPLGRYKNVRVPGLSRTRARWGFRRWELSHFGPVHVHVTQAQLWHAAVSDWPWKKVRWLFFHFTSTIYTYYTPPYSYSYYCYLFFMYIRGNVCV